jgi:thiosulfate/3-mercaptopyruvate sulfurtransferase
VVIPPVVDTSWWREHGAHHPATDVVLADVRWYLDGRSGRGAYERGHIPGAVFVDLERWLAGPADAARGRHPLPHPDLFAAGMAAVGVGDRDVVVAYDDAGGVIAARLVWMLRTIGHEAALLDGGLAAFDEPLEAGAATRPTSSFTPRPWPPSALADIDEAADPANLVIDGRDSDRYRGEHEPVDRRAGHIPGARNVACRGNLSADGRLLPPEQLRRRFQAEGVVDGAMVIAYCGSGVTACHNLLAMEHAGLGKGRLFPGSWSQYSQAGDRAVATGSAPG